MASDLKKRVLQFKMMQLPDQPMIMHMGTVHLVDDLSTRITELEDALRSAGLRDRLLIGQVTRERNDAWMRGAETEAKLREAVEVMRELSTSEMSPPDRRKLDAFLATMEKPRDP